MFFILIASFNTSAAAEEKPWLELNRAIEKSFAGGDTHSYRVATTAGQYFRVTVDQRGIDIAIKIHGPEGNELVTSDLSDKGDIDSAVWIAKAAGECRIDIVAAKAAPRGAYRIELAELRAPNEQDRQRVAAQEAFLEAEKLFAENKPESRRKAIEQYDRAMRLWRELGERSYEALAMYNLADTRRLLGDLPKAVELFQQALQIRRATGRRADEAAILSALGAAYSTMGQKEKAVEHYLQSLPIRRETGDRDGEAVTLNALGAAYSDLGEKRKARELYEQSLALRRDPRGKMITMANLGRVYRDLGEKRKAIKTQQEVLSLRRALKDRNGEAATLTDLGLIYSDIGEHQQALDSFTQALAIQRAPNTINFIGRTYYLLGAPQEALRYYDQALALMRTAKNRQGEADTLNNQALAFLAAEQYPQALAALDQALPIAREIKARPLEGSILNNYGRIHASMGDARTALEYYTQSLPLTRANGIRQNEAAMLNNIGFAHETLGDPAAAMDFHQQALKTSRDIGDRRREANVRYGIARIESARNRLKQARNQIAQTIEIVESLRAKLASPELRAEYRASVQRYYDLHIDLLMRMHKRQPRSGFSAEALQVSERARAQSLIELLTESSAEIREGVDPSLAERERDLREQLNAKTTEQIQSLGDRKKAEQAAALTREIERLNADLRELQSRIRQASPRYAALTQPRPLASRDIQRLLDANTMLLEYSLGQEHSYLWAVTKTSLRGFQLPKREAIEAAARRFYESINARNQFIPNESNQKRLARIANADAETRTTGAALTRMILGPVANQLGGKRLVFVADGALQYTPFAALPEPLRAGRPLIVGHEITWLPSASTLATLRREAAGKPAAANTVTVIADPVFEPGDERVKIVTISTEKKEIKKADADPSPNPLARVLLVKSAKDAGAADAEFRIPRLPNTRREAETILSLAPSNHSVMDFAANRAAVTGGEIGQSRIVHFATHGFLNAINPELSGLVLSMVDERGAAQNGLLLAPEIYNLKLTAAELVVLSACQTGLGKEVRGEGVVGLTRGFMYAGAPRVVVSLWNVNDRATADLMNSFYQGLLGKRLRPAAALRAAQIEVWKRNQWQAPYYWAAFGLQGEWR